MTAEDAARRGLAGRPSLGTGPGRSVPLQDCFLAAARGASVLHTRPLLLGACHPCPETSGTVRGNKPLELRVSDILSWPEKVTKACSGTKRGTTVETTSSHVVQQPSALVTRRSLEGGKMSAGEAFACCELMMETLVRSQKIRKQTERWLVKTGSGGFSSDRNTIQSWTPGHVGCALAENLSTCCPHSETFWRTELKGWWPNEPRRGNFKAAQSSGTVWILLAAVSQVLQCESGAMVKLNDFRAL